MRGVLPRYGGDRGVSGPQAAASARPRGKPAAEFEVRFLTKMIDHHQMGVDMAGICAKQAGHAQLRSLAQKITATQSSEIEMMQGWLEDWYAKSHEPRMTSATKGQMTRLGSLGGSEFEIAFLRAMTRHHSDAIADAKEAVDRAAHTEVSGMAQETIEKQGAEVDKMQDWLCRWHDLCGEDGSKRASS